MKLLVGDLRRYGMPEPDHELLERHVIVNSQLLYHIGHGDIMVKPDVAELRGQRVAFVDGSEEYVDLVVYATGFRMSFPFLDSSHLGRGEGAPELYLNVFHPRFGNLFFVGMIESVDGGNWRLFASQADVVAAYVKAQDDHPQLAAEFDKLKSDPSSFSSGCALPHYVRNRSYLRALRQALQNLGGDSSSPSSTPTPVPASSGRGTAGA
jgi:hypothetical protein